MQAMHTSKIKTCTCHGYAISRAALRRTLRPFSGSPESELDLRVLALALRQTIQILLCSEIEHVAAVP